MASGYKHGIEISENTTMLSTPITVGNIIVAVGTAPIHLATQPTNVFEPTIAYRYSEAVEQLGFSADFDKYTLCEVMQAAFSLYNISPICFINVLDKNKHFNVISESYGGLSNVSAHIEGDIDLDSFKVTSGEYRAPTKLSKGEDYEVVVVEADDSDTDNVIAASTTLNILNDDEIEDNKIKVTYRTMRTALGGEAITSEVTLSGAGVTLPTDTVVESVVVESGGVNTLQTLERGVDFKVEYSLGECILTLLDDSKVVDDLVDVEYHEIDPSQVTIQDVIGGVDLVTGKSSGIELVDSIFPRYSFVPSTLIAPGFSDDANVVAALSSKAKNLSGIFKAMAVVDISTEAAKTYQAVVEAKSKKNLMDAHLIACWPRVKAGSQMYYLSTHLACLMARVDAENNDIPYVSPSNKALQVDAAVLNDGTEVYLTQGQANLLNANGVGTPLAFSGFRYWGNRTSAYPSSTDVKDNFIPIRRMFNYIGNGLITNFFSQLDMPLNRRQLDSLVSSAQVWLNSLASAGALIGGQVQLSESNTQAKMLDGLITFDVSIAPPPPARALTYSVEYNVAYLQSLVDSMTV